MKNKQKIIALLGVILVLSLSILPIVTSADVIGDSGIITGWGLEGTLSLYEYGPGITSDWGYNDPWFPVVDQLDIYTDIDRSGDLMIYDVNDYSVGVDTVSYSLYPWINRWIVNMSTDDILTLRLSGAFADITDGDEWPYLKISFNRSAYIIKSYYLSFSYYDENIRDFEFYEETRSNWYRSYFEIDAAWPELLGFYFECEIISTVNLPGDLRIIIDHSYRELEPDIDESSYYAGYNAGYSDGLAAGQTEGYQSGYDAGVAVATGDIEARLARARQDGYNQGLEDATTNRGAARYTSWLITAVQGFLNFELFPGFSFAGLFGVLIAILLAIAFLRYFSGG